jgi:hypothetical protein
MLWLSYIIGEFRRAKEKKKERPLGFPFIHMVFLLQESLYIYVFDIAVFYFLVIFFVI